MKRSLGARVLVVPTPVWIVGTYDSDYRPNIMTAAWGGVCCSRPPCVYVSLRKATYTYGSLMERKAFTVSVPSEDYVREADFVGIASGRDVDKFTATGFTPVRSTLVDAPYVDEASLILECKVINVIEIGLHTQFIGEIIDVKADASVLSEEDKPNIEKVKPFIYSPGTSSYNSVGRSLGQAFSIGKDIQRTVR